MHTAYKVTVHGR